MAPLTREHVFGQWVSKIGLNLSPVQHSAGPNNGTAPDAPERKSMFDDDSTMRAEVGKNNAWLQSGIFIMAVRAVGLSAGPMGGFDAASVDADFNAGSAHRAFMVVNVGEPSEDARFPRLPRLSADIAVRTI